VGKIDRTRLTAARALRCTCGFAFPLLIGLLTKQILVGVSIAIGALMLGSIGLTETYRVRSRAMLVACVCVAFSAFMGSVTGHDDLLVILVAGLWGFGAGLLVALGPTMTVVGTQATIVLIILAHFRLPPAQAALQALLVLAGALFQAMLAFVPFPGRKTILERTALADLYQILSSYAVEPTFFHVDKKSSDALLNARTILASNNTRSARDLIFLSLLDEAEHVRMSILLLRRWQRQLLQQKQTQHSELLNQLLLAAAGQLEDIARHLQQPLLLVQIIQPYRSFRHALAALRRQSGNEPEQAVLNNIITYAETLSRQLHTAGKLVRAWRSPKRSKQWYVALPHPQEHPRYILTTLRANLTPRSSVFRHAIRMSIAMMVSMCIYRFVPLPVENSYWIPMTVVLVLKPEFNLTISRGLARTLGTMLGAAITTALIALLGPSQSLLVLLCTVAIYLGFSLLYVNYALFSLFFTIETVCLLSLVEPSPLTLALARAINTAIGGLLGILIYILWPSWEWPHVMHKLAERLEAQRHYAQTILKSYIDLRNYNHEQMDRERDEARLRRSNAYASVQRALHEPAANHLDAELVQGLLAAEDALSEALLILDSNLQDKPERHLLPELHEFVRRVDETMQSLNQAMHEQGNHKPMPNLEQALKQCRKACTASQKPFSDWHLVLSEAKTIVRALENIQHLLASQESMPQTDTVEEQIAKE
jgi:uncharacterized membrane protein YccC